MASVAVIGRSSSREVVDSSIAWLRSAGFRPNDVSVMVEDQASATEAVRVRSHRRTFDGAAVGSVFGAIAGGAFAWLVAIGVLVVPQVSTLLGVPDPRVSTLAGIGAGGAAGWLLGAVVGLCMPAHGGPRYDGASVRKGAVLLSVSADDVEWAVRARRQLEEPGVSRVPHLTDTRPVERHPDGL